MQRTLFTLLAFLTAQLAYSQNVNQLTWLTEDLPPYNYVENNELKGASVEIVKHIMRQDNPNIVKDIHVLPWSTAYNRAQNEENIALFTTSFLKSRENLFQWVGPIAISKKAAITLESKNLTIQKHSDLNKYKWGAIKDDEGHLLLLQHNVNNKNITTTRSVEELFKLLYDSKVDAISYEPKAATYHLSKHSHGKEKVKNIFTIKSSPMFIALSKSVSPETVNELQNRIHSLRGIHMK